MYVYTGLFVTNLPALGNLTPLKIKVANTNGRFASHPPKSY